MTSTSPTSFGTDEHPEVTEISDLMEGLLSPDRSAEVRAHLSDCELCVEVQTSLEEIRDALGTLPGPVRMPSDIAGRIDAALAAEALLDATTPDGLTASTATEPDLLPEDPIGVSRETTDSDVVSRETDPVGRSSRKVADRPGGHARAATGPGRFPRAARRRRNILLATAGAAAALTLGALLLPGALPKVSDAADAGKSASQEAADGSGSSLDDRALEKRVRSLLADGNTGGPPQGTASKAEPNVSEFTTKASPGTPVADAPTMPACVRDGINRDDAPLAVGMDVLEGREAYIVVLPHGSDSTRVDAYVVDADCVTRTPSAPGVVLGTHTYTR